MKKSQTQRAPETKWIEVPDNLKLGVPFIRATPLRPIGTDAVQYEAMTDRGPLKIEIANSASFMVSNGEIYDDMCDMDILNEPEILNNLVQRYRADKIFTFIGPTLIVVNPYRVLPEYFSNESMMRIRDKILAGTTSTEKPHIYLIAGNAYTSMVDQEKKQAIVISGESGAGKTQSTKYCMQILTSLSHKQSLPIQAKILACNPILEAFGNSKTIRNDNSSRFGKYVQIYFSNDNTILGASISSYLLEKSRVVSAAEKERSFHIFYALIASDIVPLQKASYYNYLSRSKCYEAAGIDDKAYFNQIRKSMKSIGFNEKQEARIWGLLCSVLELGNIQFDDTAHKQNQAKPCQIKNKKEIQKIAKSLGIGSGELEKILLFEKKKFLKDITFSPYNKNRCYANINTLSKAVYNAIFEFVLYKIQRSLRPQKNRSDLSINILDIFGFQNFDFNSFEQFCINFTNEKLLKLYNKYVFEKQMEILKEDGLYDQVANIKPPTNDAVIEVIAGKLSLFSIINDLTNHQQFKDFDIIQTFQSKLEKNNASFLKFDKIHKTKFIIVHSQCNVKYDIEGFKQKNQDKVLPEILQIVTNLFQHESKQQAGKTLLSKFSIQIDQLMNQLNSSCVHFIRCIKPNEKKVPHLTEEQYMITQVRYLGVFETIQIRKKTFPSRWLYQQFLQRFQSLFPLSTGNARTKTEKILKQLTTNNKQFLLGNKRVYMNPQLESKLSKKLHEQMKKKMDAAKKILRGYRKYKFRKQIKSKLKLLVKRIRLWKAFCEKQAIKLEKYSIIKIKQWVNQKKQQERLLMNKKLIEAKHKRQEEEKKLKDLNTAKRNQNQAKYCQSLSTVFLRYIKRKAFKNIKNAASKKETQKQRAKYNKFDQTPVKGVSTKMQDNYTSNMNDSVLNQSIVIDNRDIYRRQSSGTTASNNKNYEFNESFAEQQSIMITNDKDIIFQGNLQVPMFSKNQCREQLEKLRLILAEKYQIHYNQSEEDFFSPPSDDANFQIEQTQSEMMNKIVGFDSKEFFKEVLRRRTNFFGIEKDQDDILVCKPKPLSKSLTLISENDEKDAIRIFKSLLKISEEAKLENVFKLIEVLIGLCHGTSPQLKNQIFLQLLKQSNTDLQLPSVRILQTLAVFLHIFSPDKNFLMAGLNFFFKKLSQQKYTQKQNEYVRYNFKKILRKIQKPHSINYLPIKYQMMALMCKRKISLPVYLPIGSSVLVRVQSYDTFSDVKTKVLQQLGINSKRLIPQLFTFFQIVNFDNQQLEQSPINENFVVWDTVTYWQKAKDKYKEKGILPPVFFLMLKIRYTFECHYSDQETVEIMFAQAYFQYFVGRLHFQLEDLSVLAACIKKLKYAQTSMDDYKASYPAWALKKFSEGDMISKLKRNCSELDKKGYNQYDMKFRFLSIAAKNQLCMGLAVGTDQNVKMYMKPKKIIITDKNQVVEQIPVKTITKFAEDSDKFVYSVRGSNQTKIMYTEHASICCNYLSLLPSLVKLKSGSTNNVLGGL